MKAQRSKSTKEEQLRASRVIVFAQSVGVIASISGLIGVTLAYKALKRSSSKQVSVQEPPTIE